MTAEKLRPKDGAKNVQRGRFPNSNVNWVSRQQTVRGKGGNRGEYWGSGPMGIEQNTKGHVDRRRSGKGGSSTQENYGGEVWKF